MISFSQNPNAGNPVEVLFWNGKHVKQTNGEESYHQWFSFTNLAQFEMKKGVTKTDKLQSQRKRKEKRKKIWELAVPKQQKGAK